MKTSNLLCLHHQIKKKSKEHLSGQKCGGLLTNLEKLQSFFRAENDRDWTSYTDFLHPDVSWELHGIETLVISGKESYLKHIKSVYDKYNNHFTCLNFETDHLQNCIVTLLENDLGQRSCDIFDFENGLIVNEYEFQLN